MTFNEMNVSLYHISGKDINISDFISRNPFECANANCQVRKSLSVELEIAVKSLNTEDIISGNFKIPCTNHVSWKNAQKEDNDLRRVYSHLSSGSQPGRKKKNLKTTRRYLQYLTVSNSGLLVHRKI